MLSARSSWTLVGATIITWAFLLFGYSDSYPWLSLVVVATGLVGLSVVALAWLYDGDEFPKTFGWITLGISLLAFVVWCWIQVHLSPNYSTDEAAFDQFAAQLVSHGHDPYTVSMAKSFTLFHVSPDSFTFRLNGTPVTQLSYPALSFLLYVPFILIGWSTQLAVGINVIAWTTAIALAYWLLPKEVKPLAIVLGALGVYTGFAVGGVTDALYVPFLIVAVYKWDQSMQHTSWRRWISPAAMGLAMAIKQTPWFVLVFLVIGLYLDALQGDRSHGKARNNALGYLWRSLLVFLIPNAVFVIANPNAWLRGVLTPIFGSAVPAGQGWIAMSNFLGIGGSSLQLYSLLSLTIFLQSVVFFIVFYPRSKALAVLLPSFILFFSERSFASYLVMLILPTLVASSTMQPIDRSGLPISHYMWGTKLRRYGVITTAGLFGIALVAVTLFRQPITIQIESVTTTGQLATVVDATVNVTNTTSHSIHPLFSCESGGAITAPWNVTTGPDVLAAGHTATYVLQAPNFLAQPSLSGGFQIVALSQSPAAMSVSGPYTPTVFHLILDPEAVNTPVQVGTPITLSAQVVNSTNNPVRESGISVYLGQVSYTQQGLVFSEAVINGGQIGQTPIEARTNAHGVAKFVITGTQSTANPVYFEANLINHAAAYPYGYSDIVPIQFTNKPSR